MTSLDLYTWKTSNGRKATIMLEECGLDYNVHPIDISADVQFSDEFVAINPNSKIPALVDHDGPGGKKITIFESGAILMYLSEKTGLFMPKEIEKKYEVIQWVMFQMGGVGPIFGQVHHFKRAAKEKVPYAIDRYFNECKRLYGVLDTRLESQQKQFVEKILQQSGQMALLVSDLLRLARLESGTALLEQEPCFLDDFYQPLIDIFAPIIEDEELKLEWSMPQELPVVFVDPKLIRQIFVNLVDNAIKYTERGLSLIHI